MFDELQKEGDNTDVADEGVEGEREGSLTVDVYKDGDSIVVESTVAGVEPDNVDVNITNESVSIKGERKRDRHVEEDDYYYRECFWGSFSRSIILPEEVDPEESEAKLSQNGVLTVRMPLVKKRKAKKLDVRME